ncbi:hypothetical protein GDO78_007491 [Eleutherodactylus coqui]|uniref:Uncharacterized protein n=1 Tax=Eleutherodactylus coqui TaxID=57060 RepID=A0A8J6FHG3_ELECQ|nr:hypothetical protein GDO78_007491 [Eleutherodactylus coqui]
MVDGESARCWEAACPHYLSCRRAAALNEHTGIMRHDVRLLTGQLRASSRPCAAAGRRRLLLCVPPPISCSLPLTFCF